MGRIVWLASYPKSGNTWMRVLLTNYLRDADAPADINELDPTPLAGARLWFDEWAGVEASALSDSLVECIRPEVYRCMAGDVPDNLYMKVHDSWRRNHRGVPLFPGDATAGVLYIIRNPLDLAVSYACHLGQDLETTVEMLCDPETTLARPGDGLPDQLPQRVGSWSGHVRSWIDESGLPAQIVRYEDLHRDPEAVFEVVVRFCGLPHEAARIRRAVAFSSFAELQRQERENGFRERSQCSSDLFFRRGEVGAGRGELRPDLVKRLVAAHGREMRRFGYMDDAWEPRRER